MANGAPSPGRVAPRGGAVDLDSLRAMTPEKQAEGQFYAEMNAGMRCGGCGRRITLGFKFTAFRTEYVEGQATAVAIVKSACTRPECDHAGKLQAASSAAEAVEFAWFDEAGADAPVPEAVEKRHEAMVEKRRAAAEAAAKSSEGNATAPAGA